MMIRLLFLALVGGAMLFSPVAAHGATITVNSDADAGGTCPGATCTLRQAILAAATGDTINFAAGITTINLTSAELVIDKNLTISGPGANVLTVQRSVAGGIPQFRIFNVSGFNSSVSISGLTIARGASSSCCGGGGIGTVSSATLTVTGCTISGNTSSTSGGGINSDGFMSITNSTISGNTSSSIGGGVYSDGFMSITNSIISGNTSSSSGGGIYSDGLVSITNSTISGNTSSNSGGGIYNVYGVVSITNSTISGNTASRSFGDSSGGLGGGILNTGTVNLTSSTISGNVASSSFGSGGGVGGGILTTGFGGGTVNLTSSTISGNTATAFDGTGTGGGIANEGSGVNLRNTIIALNTAAIGPDVTNGLTSYGFNLIGNDSDSTIPPATGDQIGTRASPIDPLLGPLQYNGGSTFTQALQSDSPAVNAGDPNAPARDQRGYLRANLSDIGAFEFGGTIPVSLANISTRLRVEIGDSVLIGGFIITGTQPKKVIVRAIGPSLPLTGVLADPILELRDSSGGLIAVNDNWRSDQEADIIATTIPPSNNLESAIVTTLPANNSAYTAIVRGVNNGTGVGLVEAYDLNRTVDSKLGNISTRGLVQTGDNVLIGGLIVLGEDPQRVIVRAIGPSLNLPGKLANPILELRDGNGALLRSNDDWRTDQEAEIIATTIPPTNDLESAIVTTLPANGASYTAIVRGVNGSTGVGVVEVYALN